jgi:hypothetical protein
MERNNAGESISIVDHNVSLTVLFAIFQLSINKTNRLSFTRSAITDNRDGTKLAIGRKTTNIDIEVGDKFMGYFFRREEYL